jgi:hypothetical protein
MDPLEIESRFSTERSFFSEQEERNYTYDDFQPFISLLPRREIDLIDLYFRKEKKQKEIAEYFSVTQGAVSHRLSRACKRLQFLRDMPKIDGDIKDILRPHFTSFEMDLIVFMVNTTCQSKTADMLNEKHKLRGLDRMTQVKVRHKFDRFIMRLRKLKRKHLELKICHKLLDYTRRNLYMMHEVILPHFNRGYKIRMSKVM